MKIFELFGDILINDKASKEIDAVGEKGKILGINIDGNIGKVAAFGTAAVAAGVSAGAAMLKLATDASDVASRINDMSAKMGISTRGFQEWDYVLKQSGVDVGVLQGGMKTLNNVIDAATQGGEDQVAMFKKLGVSLTDNKGKLKDTETIFNEVVTALQGMPEGANKAALSNDLLGKSSTEMSAIINGTSEDLVNMKNRANELGLVMSEEAVAAGDEFGDTLEDVKMSLGAVWREIGTALMPPLKAVLDFMLNTAIPGIKKWWEETVYGFKQIQLIAVNMASSVLGAFLDLGKGIDSIWLGIVESALSALNGVMDMLGGWIDKLNATFGTNFAKPNFEEFGKNIIEGMKAGAESELDRTVSILKDAFDIMAQEIEASFNKSGINIKTTMKTNMTETADVVTKTSGIVTESVAGMIKETSEDIAQYVENANAQLARLTGQQVSRRKTEADERKKVYDEATADLMQYVENANAEYERMSGKKIELEQETTEETLKTRDNLLVAARREAEEYNKLYAVGVKQIGKTMIDGAKEYTEYIKNLNKQQAESDTQTTKTKMDNLHAYVNEASRQFSEITRVGITLDEKMETLSKNLASGAVNLSVWINTISKWGFAEWNAYRKAEKEGKMPQVGVSGNVINQNITVNSPKNLSASEVARQTKNASKTVYMN